MLYNSCNECPHNGRTSCPLNGHEQYFKDEACIFLTLKLKRFPPLPNDSEIEKQADQLAAKIMRLVGGYGGLLTDHFPHLQETQYSYSDFFHIAFAAETPDNQAKGLQAVLMSTAARADYMKEDITKARFYIDDKGAARAELPSEIKLRTP